MNTEGLTRLPTTREIHTAEVCRAHNFRFHQLQEWRKTPARVAARAELWHRLVIREKGCTLTMGARYLRKHHTTALNSLRKYSSEHYGTGPKAKLSEMRQAYLASLQPVEIAA